MEETLAKIKKYLIDSETDEIVFPDNVNSIFDESKSKYLFSFKINNTCTSSKTVALLHAGISNDRIQQLNAQKQYTSIGGQLITTTLAANTIIPLYDNPDIINKIVDFSCDCVATQNVATVNPVDDFKRRVTESQVIYKNATGQITYTTVSQFGNIDFFREYVKHFPVRIFEMQFNSANVNFFNTDLINRRIRPYTSIKNNDIQLEDFFKPVNAQDTKIIVPCEIVVDGETYMAVTLPALTEVTVTFKISAVYNTGFALLNKTKLQDFFKKFQEKQTEIQQIKK